METVINKYRFRVRKWCASCGRKDVDEEGTRICTGMMLKVPPDFVCPRWQLSEGLQQAGHNWGLVRHKDTKEIVIK